ncbi:MAG: hypothetical protein MUO52_16500 [Desulfobacterales bacterium]|nr:hypothetical protein [Desulfobacterales bacterium]
MAEIKSTLEIILEKTKGLTMSDEEREAFQREEVEGKVKGLVQKRLDGFLPLDGLQKEMESFGAEKEPMVMKALKRECLDRMDPEVDNSPLFEILQEVAHVDPGPFLELQSEFQRRVQQEEGEREKSLLKRLEERGISGSAVIPNVAANPEWLGVLEEMKQAFKDEAGQIMK